MNRVYPQWIFVLILSALVVLNLGIALTTSCGQKFVRISAQGPYCSVQQTSAPSSTQKSDDAIAIVQEFSILLSFFIVLSLFSFVLFQKKLPRGFILWRKAVNRDVIRAGPSSFGVFIPQLFASHDA